jgi:hypothetical protein
MGNTLASGSGTSLEVGKNYEQLYDFTSNVEFIFMGPFINKIKYNNSKYGNAYLAGTIDNSGVLLAQNKCFNFQWKVVENQDTGDSFVLGNHTKKCDKNSIAIVEILRIDPVVLQEKFQKVSLKFKNDSDLDKLIKKLKK